MSASRGMGTGLPADDGAGTGIPAGTGMQTGLFRTSLPVILGFLPIILSFSLLSCAFPCPLEFSPPVILSFPPCHPERSGGSSFSCRPSEERGKDPSSAPPPQDDRAEARHAYGRRRRTPACLRAGTRKPSRLRTTAQELAYPRALACKPACPGLLPLLSWAFSPLS